MNLVKVMQAVLKLLSCKHDKSYSAFRYTNLGDGAVMEFCWDCGSSRRVEPEEDQSWTAPHIWRGLR